MTVVLLFGIYMSESVVNADAYYVIFIFSYHIYCFVGPINILAALHKRCGPNSNVCVMLTTNIPKNPAVYSGEFMKTNQPIEIYEVEGERS